MTSAAKLCSSAVLLTLLLQTCTVSADDKIGFVYSVVRHGARACLVTYPPYPFEVANGYLTSQGMRQRFLLGTFNRDRYINQYGLLDEMYNPN